MAKTLGNLRTTLAYRLGENSATSDSNEQSRRDSFINEAYRDIMRRHFWWFTETTDSFDSVADQASYTFGSGGVASDIRAILELRFQDKLFTKISQVDGMSSTTIPYSGYSESYFLFNNKIYFVPPLASAVSDGVDIKYYKTHTELSSSSDTIIIPDIFSDVIVAYAYGRVCQIDGERGSASDGFEEYKEILNLMDQEQNKYLFSLQGTPNPEVVGTYE